MSPTTPVSTELVQHMNTELITKIQELEEACNELEAAASQTGTERYVCALPKPSHRVIYKGHLSFTDSHSC